MLVYFFSRKNLPCACLLDPVRLLIFKKISSCAFIRSCSFIYFRKIFTLCNYFFEKNPFDLSVFRRCREHLRKDPFLKVNCTFFDQIVPLQWYLLWRLHLIDIIVLFPSCALIQSCALIKSCSLIKFYEKFSPVRLLDPVRLLIFDKFLPLCVY